MRRRFTLLAAMLAGLALLLTACGASGGSAKTVDADTFATTIARPGVVLVDVRTPSEFAASHIEGAINIDWQGDFADGIADLDKTKTYAVYCASGTRSGAAAAQMASHGFTDVQNLDGGLVYWQAAGYGLVA